MAFASHSTHAHPRGGAAVIVGLILGWVEDNPFIEISLTTVLAYLLILGWVEDNPFIEISLTNGRATCSPTWPSSSRRRGSR